MTKEKNKEGRKMATALGILSRQIKVMDFRFLVICSTKRKVKIEMLKDNMKCKTCSNDYTGINNLGYTFLFSFNYCQVESVLVERHNPQRRKKV